MTQQVEQIDRKFLRTVANRMLTAAVNLWVELMYADTVWNLRMGQPEIDLIVQRVVREATVKIETEMDRAPKE